MKSRKHYLITIASILIASLILILSIILVLKNKNYNKDEFKNLVKLNTQSISNDQKIRKIIDELEFGNFNVKIEKDFSNGEKLTLYYDCADEGKVIDYYRNSHKMSLIEKDMVLLFSLVSNLDEIKFVYLISNSELINEYH